MTNTAIPTHQYRSLGNGAFVYEPICRCYVSEPNTAGIIYCPLHEEMYKMNGIITPVNKEISQQHCNELDALKLADSILALIKEAGYAKLDKDQTTPLTSAEKFLQDYGCLEILKNGERIRTIKPFYPEPTPEYPLTKLHISGDYIASKLRLELEVQQDMINAGWRKVA